MIVGGRGVGGLVFGRFGGPAYPAEHIRLAEFVAWHVGQLLENRRMARRIATLEAQRELARMQDEFVSTVSHELRTPLGFIKGYITTLLRDDAEWDSTRPAGVPEDHRRGSRPAARADRQPARTPRGWRAGR